MRLSHRTLSLSAGPLLAAAVLSARPTWSQEPPPAPPPPPPALPVQTVEGTTDGYNLDPHGRINSIVVKPADGRLAQFDLPPDLGESVTQVAPVGQHVTATGRPDRAVGDRTIYHLAKLTGADGKATLSAPTPGEAEPTVHVEGTVKRLNVSPHGEVDGAVLDGGDFVHTGPALGATLTPGGKVSADGVARPMADGHRAVEATTVNGTPVPHPPPPHPGGPRAPVPPAPPTP